jgi:hypothetical protein
VTEVQGLIESPTFSVEEDIPEQISLLEIDCFEIPPAKCVLTEGLHRVHERVHYSTKIMILVADRSSVLGLELEEDEIFGEREGAVARQSLERNSEGVVLMEFDPYVRSH